MDITINIAGALMFCALLVVAVAVLGSTLWAVAQVRTTSRAWEDQLMAKGYQNALRDTLAAFHRNHVSITTDTDRGLTANQIASRLKEAAWADVQAEFNKDGAK